MTGICKNFTGVLWKVKPGIIHYLLNWLKHTCLLYTSDAADERSSVDLGGRRIIKKKNNIKQRRTRCYKDTRSQQMK